MRAAANSTLLPEVLLIGYRNGFFPMAESDTAEIRWYRPDPRAIIPLDGVRISRSLRKVAASNLFTVTIDQAFEEVMTACSEREHSWISPDIIDAYVALHEMGYAHSIETWHDGKLCGGLYGVHIGAAFFGESMFSKVSNASKVAFHHLVDILHQNDFSLLDTQYINSFTESLGAIEVSDAAYSILLQQALSYDATFA